MATNKPRIQVTISEQAHSALKELYAVSGRPMSAWIADMVNGSIPAFQLITSMLSTSAKIEGAAREHWEGALEADEMHIKHALSEVMLNAYQDIERFSGSTHDTDTQAKRGAGAGVPNINKQKKIKQTKTPPAVACPPSINKGGRFNPQSPDQHSSESSKSLIFKVFDADIK
jgi:hypothetical protein